ncbi:MAG: hypothetical protein LBV68_06575 [Spirochaetaceae bacterium]|jgi:uncharacterized membrane protein|nr:hypothetical protein [Spirochaetaceae bacterium]
MSKIKQNIKGLLGLVALFYPLIVFLSVVVFNVKPNRLAVFIVLFGILYFIMVISNSGKKKPVMFISPILLFLIGAAGFCLDAPFILELFPKAAGKSNYVIKFYPVLTNTAYFIIFFTSMIFPPSLAFDISVLIDAKIMGTAAQKPMEIFCKKASIIWCVFFILDSLVSLFTIFIETNTQQEADTIWAIYNGAITYVLMGIILLFQIILGKMLIRKTLRAEAHNPPENPEHKAL